MNQQLTYLFCAPSRPALMTGYYPRRIDMATGSDFGVLLLGCIEVAKRLRASIKTFKVELAEHSRFAAFVENPKLLNLEK